MTLFRPTPPAMQMFFEPVTLCRWRDMCRAAFSSAAWSAAERSSCRFSIASWERRGGPKVLTNFSETQLSPASCGFTPLRG